MRAATFIEHTLTQIVPELSDTANDEYTEDEVRDAASDTIVTAVEERDRMEDAIWKKRRDHELKHAFEEAKEQEQIAKYAEQPLVLARRALSNVEAIPAERSALQEAVEAGMRGRVWMKSRCSRRYGSGHIVPNGVALLHTWCTIE